MLLVKERVAQVAIYLPVEDVENKESSARYAARELQYYLGQMTGASFPIEGYCEGGKGIFVNVCTGELLDTVGEDGFVIRSQGDILCISGGKRGVIYGVYELLEMLGCRFFTATCERVPVVENLTLADDYDICKKPAFEYREHDYYEALQNPRFIAKCRYNGSRNVVPDRMGGFLSYAWYVHTFERMVPVAVYGESHPEYYAISATSRAVS